MKNNIEKKYYVEKKFFRAKDVAEILSIGLSTVWYFAKIGKLTPKKLSSRITVFKKEEIDALIFVEIEAEHLQEKNEMGY